jgi:AcrR family transcriptional regulator
VAPRRTAADIVDAVGTAAHGLFLERGPAAVSLRDVAAAAGVNLGLIHRYVGSKDDLVALVLDRHGAAASAALAHVSGLDDLLDLLAAAHHSSGRLFAGILLDDIDAVRLKREFPVTAALVAALEAEAPWTEPSETAALLQSLVLGWEVFSPYLLGAAGAGAPADERSVLRSTLQVIVDRDRPARRRRTA